MSSENAVRRIPKMSDVEWRFWAKVDIVNDDDSCWLWTAATGGDPPYGAFSWRDGPFKVTVPGAHRVALFFETGEIAEVTCHHCDTPLCVRPSHLYAGTSLTNSADKVARGRCNPRDQRGEANNYAVLTDALVLSLRERAATGEDEVLMAEELGLQRATIALAIRGKTWKHVGGPIRTEPQRAGKRLNAENVRAIRREVANGRSYKDVAVDFGVTGGMISAVARRLCWGNIE